MSASGISMTGLRKTASLKHGLSQLAPPDLRNEGNSSGSDDDSDIAVVPVGSPLNDEELALQLENAKRIVANAKEAKAPKATPKSPISKAVPSPTAAAPEEASTGGGEGIELTTPKGVPSPVSTRSSNASSRSSPPSTRSVASLKADSIPSPVKPTGASSPAAILSQLEASAMDAVVGAVVSNPINVPIVDVKTVGKPSSPVKANPASPVVINAEALNAARASGLQAKIKRGYANWWSRVVPVPGATDPLLNTTVADGMLFPFDEEIEAYYRPKPNNSSIS